MVYIGSNDKIRRGVVSNNENRPKRRQSRRLALGECFFSFFFDFFDTN